MMNSFEQLEIRTTPVSILRDVSLSFISDQYQNMVMHRYPSELCEIFQKLIPDCQRYASKSIIPLGQGATLYYHYILHGFRNYGIRVLNIVETPAEVYPTKASWGLYLQSIDCAEVMTFETFTKTFSVLPRNMFDMIIFNYYNEERSKEENIEDVYAVMTFSLQLLKPYGFVHVEGIQPSSIHFLQSTLSNLYLYPEVCQVHIFCPFRNSTTSKYIASLRRMYIDENQTLPLGPVRPEYVLESPKKFVLITSAVKSVNNSNIFSERTRFRQLLHSVRTVMMMIPNAHIVVSEVSDLSDSQVQTLADHGVKQIFTFEALEGVKKSYAEALVMRQVFQRVDDSFCAFAKLSGRYFLIERFRETYNAEEIYCKRMRPKEVMTRFFSIPNKFFGKFRDVLQTVCEDPQVVQGEMDIEHALGRNFEEMDEAAQHFPSIGVAGFYASTTQMIVE